MFTSLVVCSIIGIAVLGSTSSEHKEEQHINRNKIKNQ